jgi:tRNA-dihydrouridine synthase B
MFGRLLGCYEGEPGPDEVLAELEWLISSAEDHLGVDRAGRYLRKFYPWYADRLGLTKRQRERLVTAPTTAHARELWRILIQPSTPIAA